MAKRSDKKAINYNKSGVGRLMKAKLPDGRTVERQSHLFFLQGEELIYAPTIFDDDDHFVFELFPVVLPNQIISQYKGALPKELQGHRIFCTCGSPGVMILGGALDKHLVCQMYLQTGYHQTSHTIKDGVLIFNADTIKNRTEDLQAIINQDIKYRPKLT